MSAMAFALVLFGCADDGTMCERLQADPVYYSSQVTCEAGTVLALESDEVARSDYPSVIARCMENGVQARLVPSAKAHPARLALADTASRR